METNLSARKYFLILFLLMVLIASIGGAALASDISSALYYGTIIVSNNGTSTSAVSTVMTLDTQALIDQRWIDEDCAHLAIKNSTGADVIFQPGANSTYPWCLWVPDIGNYAYLNYILYTGTANMSPSIAYFPGDGGMTISDNSTMEPSDNSTIGLHDTWVDTTAGAAKYIFDHYDAVNGGIRCFVSDTVSGNITARIVSPTTDNYYTSTSDGQVSYEDAATYNTAWTAATGTHTSTGTTVKIGQGTGGGLLYNIWRGFLYFNTSTIPTSANITSVVLKVYGQDDSSTAAEFDITVQDGQPMYPSNPLVVNDYSKAFYSGNGGSINTTGFATGAYNSITLNADGRSWINKGGTTKLCIRSSRDIAGTSSGGEGSQEHITIYSFDETGADKDPYLVITYFTNNDATATSIDSGEYDVEVAMADNTGADWLPGWNGGRIQFTVDADNIDAQTVTIRPDGAGNSTTWIPSAGANWECVDDVTADEDGTYVKSPGTGQTYRINIKENGVVSTSDLFTTTTSYANYSKTWNKRPSDNADWSWADINNLQIGVLYKNQFSRDLYNAANVTQYGDINSVTVYARAKYYEEAPLAYVVRVTQAYAVVTYELGYFPVMLELSASAGMNSEDLTEIFDEVGANHDKIAITLEDGLEQVFVDVEKWDATIPKAIMHFSSENLSLSSTTDTPFYFYFDNSHASNTAYVGLSGSAVAENVWDDYYVLVDHLQDNPDTSNTTDSTTYDNDGAKKGANEPLETASGLIGDAQGYDGANDYINYGNDSSIKPTTALTISCQFMVLNNDSVDVIISDWSDDDGIDVNMRATGEIWFSLGQGATTVAAKTSAAYDDGNWHRLVCRWSGSLLRIFIDGAEVSYSFQQSTATYQISANNLYLGNGVAGSNAWAGYLDEFRYANIALNDATLKANHHNLSDNLIDFIPYDSIAYAEYAYDFTISVDSVVRDRVLGVPIPDSDSDWTVGDDGVTPYIGSFVVEVDGTGRCNIDWEYGTTFQDSTSYNNDATPTFRTTSSDSDVTAVLSTFIPISTARAPSYTVSDAPDFLSDNLSMSGNFTIGPVPTPGPPGTAVIEAAAQAGGTPNIWLWGILGMLTIAMAGLGISYFEKKYGAGGGSLILRIFVAAIIFGLMIAFDKFDWWMLIFYLFITASMAMASRHIEWGGASSQHSVIGFLAMAWVGLTAINRMVEGQFITGAETSFINSLMFTQEFELFGIFKIPVMNFQFFTKGIPMILRWDYSFFGGNAQLIQYMLYSITAVVSFIIFGLIIGLLYNYFNRLR